MIEVKRVEMAVSCCAESNHADAEELTAAAAVAVADEVAAPDSAFELTPGRKYAEARSGGCQRYCEGGAADDDIAVVVIATTETVLGTIHLDHSRD